jgi:homospermidine synthase
MQNIAFKTLVCIDFPQSGKTMNILIIGCGAVAQCTVPLVLKTLSIKPQQITLIDNQDKREAITDLLNAGVRFEIQAINAENYPVVLSLYLNSGDLCIDLANEVDTQDVLMWCQNNRVHYLNSALNIWPESPRVSTYTLYKKLANVIQSNNTVTTAVLSHGANPGLISSFVKQALIDSAHYYIAHIKEHAALKEALQNNDFATIAFLLEIKAIHVTDQDTQQSESKVEKIFTNTWSIVEFVHECLAPSEIAWGTHEQRIPPKARQENGALIFNNQGVDSHIKSWLPQEEYHGMAIAHDELFSIADYLSIKNDTTQVYRPTVLFAYNPSEAAKASLKMIQGSKTPVKEGHIMTSEIMRGEEKMGCLLLSPHFSWWTGSCMSIEATNKILPKHNSTVLQVSAGVIAAIKWIIQNPQKGICFPENLDHREVLASAKPFLGTYISEAGSWNPDPECQIQSYIIKI